MQKIRWIHFSDLHLGSGAAVDTRRMRTNLPKYIAELNCTFDYAFCSGDIKEWNADYSKAADFLKTICQVSNTPLDHLYLVPGNHDIDLSCGGEERKQKIAEITDWRTSYYEPSEGLISQEDLRILQNGREDFISFIGDLFGEERARLYTEPHFIIPTEHFNILHVDSTLTYAKEHDRDFILGTGLLMDALATRNESLPTILLTHYSFDFLTQSERDYIETILADYGVQLWLAGHEHSNLIRWQREKFLECQCGNLELQKGARSCFLTGEIDLDTGEGVISVHAWFEGKNWAQYPFARTNCEDNHIYPFQLRPVSGDPVAFDVSPELANAREAVEGLSSAGGLFSGVSLNPSILTDLEYNGNTYFNNGKPYPLEQIMDELWNSAIAQPGQTPNALILGDGGMGKSTMMYHECRELLNRRQLAVYVSLQAREGTRGSIIEYVCQCLYHAGDERAKNKFTRLTASRHPHPDIVLFIDGFNELSGTGALRYITEIKALSRMPGVQIIISSRLDFLRDYGLSYFSMIHTCDLRENQIQLLFQERLEDWRDVLAQRNLLVLLKNPMMALLYASTCPIVERNVELDYLEWIIPIKNASDLLHDYYMAQIALLINRDAVDGTRIFNCMVGIEYVLPSLAQRMEHRGNTSLPDSQFEEELRAAVDEINTNVFPALPEKLQRVKRRFRVHSEQVDCDDIYELMISEMALLRSGNGRVSFAHQIFRDFLCAVYLHNSLLRDRFVDELWRREIIHEGVVQYLRNIGDETTWGTEGTVGRMLLPYRGKEAEAGDFFVRNVINCWLSAGEGERDLSGLDLRKISITDHLKHPFHGTINIDNAWVAKETLINDRHHDRIISISFSHDNRTMAALSKNGIVSITNLLTQSQLIVGEFEAVGEGIVGFDANDQLILKTSNGVYCWPTIAYDQIEAGDAQSIVALQSVSTDMQARGDALRKRLQESDMSGIIQCISENGRYLAAGYESGFIQIWDVFTQDCIANLSLSDSQTATVAFSKDGTIAALGSGGRIVQIWDIEQRKCSRILYFDQRISKLRIPTEESILECQFPDGTFRKAHWDSGKVEPMKKPAKKQFTSKTLLKRVPRGEIVDIKSTSSGNAILITKQGKAYTWDESLRKLSLCEKHKKPVTAVAICSSDDRFAASYSPEIYTADRNDRDRRHLLNGQRLVRVRIVRTGQCQLRIPTKGHALTKLQFFTSNRIVLAGFATNGDILLWELFNQLKYGREIGEWKTVEIVKNNEAEPLECTFPSNQKVFISAYADGTILIRPFSNSAERTLISTLPGIDASVLRWNNLRCNDELKKILDGYSHN